MTKSVVVTGGCGFIGTEVVRQLLAEGYRVRVVDDLSKPESQVSDTYEFIQFDLADPQRTLKAFEGMDVCINLASKIGGIGYFHKYPATIISENCKIYSSTFEAAAKCGMKRMIYVSSSMVFESTQTFPSHEEDIFQVPPPLTSYGMSKLIGEYYCRAFFDEHKLPYTILRPFNAFGINEAPGEEVGYAHVIPDLIKKALCNSSAIEILGDGEQSRCFTHVRDVARGIIMAMENEKAVNEDFNLGTSKEIRILDLARRIFEICRPGEAFRVKFVQGFTYDIRRRVPESSKAKRFLGWEPRVRLEEGLAEVVEWCRQTVQLKGGK